MQINIDINDYCDKRTVFAGRDILASNFLKKKQITSDSQGNVILSALFVDKYNFANHSALTFNSDLDIIYEYNCDCIEKSFCKHCAALFLSLDNQLSTEPRAYTAPRQFPAAKPERPAALRKAEHPEPVRKTERPAPPKKPERPPFNNIGIEVLIGNCVDDGQPVLWHPNNTEELFHTNMGIIGTMGTGKTQLTKSVITQIYRSRHDNYASDDLGILIFDYKGDYNELNADFININNARVLKPYLLPFNPFTIIKPANFKPLMPTHTASTFCSTISQIYKLGPKQNQTLLECINDAYNQCGIFAEKPETWYRNAPTFDTVYNVYKTKYYKTADSLYSAMDRLQRFKVFESSRTKTRSISELLRGVVVIDLSGYDSDIQNLIVAITLDQFYSQMISRGSGRTDGKFRHLSDMIVVDEADNFMSKNFASLKKIMKEGREFGTGVILSTQSLDHFFCNEDYSKYILTWIVHNVSDLKKKDVEYVFKLPPNSPESEQAFIKIKNLDKHINIVKLSNTDLKTVRGKAFWEIQKDYNNGGQ